MSSSLSDGLDRREFLRRAGLLGLASFVFVGTDQLRAGGRSLRLPASIPSLSEPGVVTALTGGLGQLVAFLAAPEVTVWGYSAGEAAWSMHADASNFPGETAISGAVMLDGRTLAVGSSQEHVSHYTVIDETGTSVDEYPHRSIPLITFSEDGVRWEIALHDTLGAASAALYGVAPFPDGSLLAVGSEFTEVDVTEHRDFFAVLSVDAGNTWERIDLDGLAPIYHGQPTAMARVGESVLLVNLSLHWTDLYVASEPQSWTAVEPPSRSTSPTSFLGIASLEDLWILSGIDQSFRLHFWVSSPVGGSRRWIEIPRPIAGASTIVTDLLDWEGTLIAAGAKEEAPLVTPVEV